MYKDLKKLKEIKGLTEPVKAKIEKAWTWGLITDEQFMELIELDVQEDVEEETPIDETPTE